MPLKIHYDLRRYSKGAFDFIMTDTLKPDTSVVGAPMHYVDYENTAWANPGFFAALHTANLGYDVRESGTCAGANNTVISCISVKVTGDPTQRCPIPANPIDAVMFVRCIVPTEVGKALGRLMEVRSIHALACEFGEIPLESMQRLECIQIIESRTPPVIRSFGNCPIKCALICSLAELDQYSLWNTAAKRMAPECPGAPQRPPRRARIASPEPMQ